MEILNTMQAEENNSYYPQEGQSDETGPAKRSTTSLGLFYRKSILQTDKQFGAIQGLSQMDEKDSESTSSLSEDTISDKSAI